MLSHTITKTKERVREGGKKNWEQSHVRTQQGEEDSKTITVHTKAAWDKCSAMAKEAGREMQEECECVYVVIITVYQIQYTNNYYQHNAGKEKKCRHLAS